MADLLGRSAWDIPDVGILCHDAQGQLFATTTNDEGRIRLLDRFGRAIGIFDLIVAALEIA